MTHKNSLYIPRALVFSLVALLAAGPALAEPRDDVLERIRPIGQVNIAEKATPAKPAPADTTAPVSVITEITEPEPAEAADAAAEETTAEVKAEALAEMADVVTPEPAAEPVPVSEPTPEPTPEPETKPEDDIRAAVAAWATAWSSQDVAAYLDQYAEAFTPPKKMSRSAWEQQRQQRIQRPARIEVKITAMEISLSDNGTAHASFVQDYITPSYSDQAHKALTLIQEDGRWKITREETVKP